MASSSLPQSPLEKSGKVLLILGATAVILACYLFSLFSILLLLVFIVLELGLFVVLLRFGLAGHVLTLLVRHTGLVTIFVRNLWLPRNLEYHMPLTRDDAPRFFALLDSLAAHFKIKPPRRILIEMNSGAWVRLHGVRAGAGRTDLGVGFDLLAALNLSELQAVMAHEMAHARLVQRGLKTLLHGGLARIARVSGALHEIVVNYRDHFESFPLATFFHTASDAITRLAARLVYAYSRQDEFEADRGAVQLCGPLPLRTSLLRLHLIEPRLARLPWAERLGRSETEASFTQWLAAELATSDADIPATPTEETRDPYSTHPPLQDRLAAFPEAAQGPLDPTPALSLLAQPDAVAASLIAEVRRIARLEEEKDSRALDRALRKLRPGLNLRAAHIPGIIALCLSGIALFQYFLSFDWPFLAATFVLLALSLGLFYFVRYRERFQLPVPSFADLKKTWETPWPDDLATREAETEKELKASGWATTKKKFGLPEILKISSADLARCDYLHAHVASRFALGIDPRSVPAALSLAIASASLGNHDQVQQLLGWVKSAADIRTPQAAWAAGWSSILLGDWVRAELFLNRKHRDAPQEPTFLLLLALAQLRRGKHEAAVSHAEKAAELLPSDLEARKLLCHCLLDAGRPRAAAAHLATLEDSAKCDPETALLLVRLRLLEQQTAAACEWADHLRHADRAAHWHIRLGLAFESARLDDLASDSFHAALVQGFYPEARFGLARLHAATQHDLARVHLFTALDTEKPVPPGATGPVSLFSDILDQLRQVGRTRTECRAWIVRFPALQTPANPPILRNHRLLVFAVDQAGAEAYLDEILTALLPSIPPARPPLISWTLAPKDQQPIRPVLPGVQGILPQI